MSALGLIRLLRPIAPGDKLQRHLTDCAVYEVVDRKLSRARLPPLECRHVLGLKRLPSVS